MGDSFGNTKNVLSLRSYGKRLSFRDSTAEDRKNSEKSCKVKYS